MEYLLKQRLEPADAKGGSAQLLAAVYRPEEWPAAQKLRALPPVLWEEFESARFTKAEILPEGVVGTFCVPLKRYARCV